MERKYQIIYIWSFIIISGFVLLLLYTPLGGDLHSAAYREESRYNVIPGVNYQTQIGAFSSSSSPGSSNSGSGQAYISESYRNGLVGGASVSKTVNSTVSTGFAINSGSQTGITKSNSTGGSGFAGGAMMAVGTGGKGTSGSGNFGGGGAAPFSSNTTVMQRGVDGVDDESDPGGDPTGPPLPINDDLVVLLFLVSVFSVYKWLRISTK